jgi:exopolysaccharide production protein ExoY
MYLAEQETLDGSVLAFAYGKGGRWRTLSPAQAAIKRGIDVTCALLFFTVFLPLYLCVAVGVYFTSGNPIFYVQNRIGQHGRTFRFFKFRSMVPDAEAALSAFLDTDPEARSQWDTFQKLPNDPRVTRFGRFIRRTSLDELPQFWNVLKGEMSMVGPRPCLPEQEELYGAYWLAYCSTKPGLTGLWQVSGRNCLSYDERVQLDARYVSTWSLWLDLRILLKTVQVVLTGHGSR